jgi:hypothetical protein
MIGPRATHGIRATYARGCRCDDCRAAWRDARRIKERERRARMREAGWVDGRTLRTKLTQEHRDAISRSMRATMARKRKEAAAGADGS